MKYGLPQKLPDGRYFLKITESTHQLNNLVLQGDLDPKSVSVSTNNPLFQKIDEELLSQAKVSKVAWFGKELTDETINAAFQESITDGVLGTSLSTVKGKITTVAFGQSKESIELSELAAGDRFDALLELSGLWFLKKSFGPIWRILQIRKRDGTPKIPTQYNFQDSEDEEDDPSDYLD